MLKKIIDSIYKTFKLKESGTSIETEFIAAITNYFTFLYLITLIPEIIMDIFPGVIDKDGKFINDAIIYNNVSAGQMLISLTISALIATGIASIAVGALTNTPLIQGPSLTIATFISYTVCRNFGYSYSQALAIVFISGVVFFLLAITGLEKRLHRVIPNNIKYAVTGGIGMYIVLQGLIKSYIFEKSGNGFLFINLLNFNNTHNKTAMLTICGIILIIILINKHIHGAIFIGKLVCILAAIPLGMTGNIYVNKVFISPFVFSINMNGLIDSTSVKSIVVSLFNIGMIVFVICIMDIFETISTTIAMKNFIWLKPKECENVIDKEMPKILEVDSATTSLGALIGMTTVSTYVESNTGVVEGARTGLTAIITGLLFIITVPFTTFTTAVPSAATATTLIMAGVMITGILKQINFEDVSEALPAVLTVLSMVVLNKIIVGIAIGIISYVLCNIFLFRKKIDIYLVVMSLFMLIMLIFTAI